MSHFKNHIVSRIFCLLMAFHIFNLSVDMPDAQPENIPEDLTVNDMESVVEIVLEECLDIDNAIAEHDETGDESATFELVKEFQLCCTKFPEINFDQDFIKIRTLNSHTETHYFQYFNEINPPPPKG